MKFTINKEHFSNGLSQVLNVVGTKNTMPILNNVLLQTGDGCIAMTTTNLDLGIRCVIKADVHTPGTLTLPVKKLATIVRELPETEVVFAVKDSTQAKITSGGSHYKIMGLAADEFPALPDFENRHAYDLPQADLMQMLRRVSYAQSTDENRYILNGVYFHFAEDKLTLVATDGRRLALSAMEMPVEENNVGSLILPAKTVGELERLLGKGETLKIAFNERQVAFELAVNESENAGFVESLRVVSKIVEGNYPNYRQVIPRETEHRIKLERELLLECVKRAALVISEKSLQVRFKLTTNLLEIMGTSSEYGESHESMAISYEGPEVQVAFNPHFFMDPLKVLPHDEVFFEFKDELSPGLIKTLDHFLCVVMPLRLN